jgi:hypothetical protein
MDLNTKSLLYICSEKIRKNWSEQDQIINNVIYNIIWDTFVDKFHINKNCPYFKILKKFVENDISFKDDNLNFKFIDQKTLIISKLKNQDRKKLFTLCNHLGLQFNKKNKIIKPEIWLWEFSNIKEKSFSQKSYSEKKLKSKCCYSCKKTAFDSDLFHSIYYSGLYCEECLENESDGEGEKLSNHKYEHYYI